MPNISGLVLFSPNRTIQSINTLTPVSLVAVTLYNKTTQIGDVALTDSTGNFQFTSVPSGNYILVETFGATNAKPSPVNFTAATTIPMPIAKDIVIGSITIPNLPNGSTNIDSITPNTLNIVVGASDILNQHFVDSPVIYSPSPILNRLISGPNLVTICNNGTFGTYPNATAVNTSPASNPYSSLSLGFGYQQYSLSAPQSGNISLVNIETLNPLATEWNLTDHTTGNETGRFLIVNSASSGQSIFSQSVNVTPNTPYVLSLWIANQFKNVTTIPPGLQFLVNGISPSGNKNIFATTLPSVISSPTLPQWNQIGAVFNSGSYSTININILNSDSATAPNIYAIDDISLNASDLNSNIIQAYKTVKNNSNPSSFNATIGDTLTYTVSIVNTSTISSAFGINILDTISGATSFVQGSVLGGSLSSSTNGVLNIITNTIAPGSSSLVSFNVVVNSNATLPTISNSAYLNYQYILDSSLPAISSNLNTNLTTIPINIASINLNKSVSPVTITTNGIATYTINLNNQGTVSANNVLLTDYIPSGLQFVLGSFNLNSQSIPGIMPVNGLLSVTIPTIPANSSAVVTFEVLGVTTNTSTIVNTATVSYNFLNGSVQSPTVLVANSVSLGVIGNPSAGGVTIVKSALNSSLSVCDFNTYTITISNNTSSDLGNVIFYDTLPCGMIYKPYSLSINYFNQHVESLKGGVSIGTIPSNSTKTITFKAKLESSYNNLTLTNVACMSYNSSSTISNNYMCSNPVSSTINQVRQCYANLDCDKRVTKSNSTNGFITYTVDLCNTGNTCANNIVFNDYLPLGLVFKSNSFCIDCENIPTVSVVNGLLNVAISCIEPGCCKRLKFSALATTLANTTIINTATVSYNYINNYSLSNTKTSSSTVAINIGSIPSSSVFLVKGAQFSNMHPNQTNVYTVTIINNTSSCLENVVFYDTLPSQIAYKPYSFKVNSQNNKVNSLNNGVYIGSIKPYSEKVVKFKVVLLGISSNSVFNNSACISYSIGTIPNSNTVCSNSFPVNLITFC